MKIVKEGKELFYKVIPTKNKHSYIKPNNGYVEIHLSYTMQLNKVLNKIESLFDKYYDLTKYQPPNNMYLFGHEYTIEFTGKIKETYKIENSVIKVFSGLEIDKIKDIIYEEELKKHISSIMDYINETVVSLGYKVVPVKIKKLKSKYGSYHTKKHEITLSTLLAKLNKEFSVYVLFHEYAHQKHPHHQPSFYEALSKLYPNYKTAQRNLKTTKIF